MEPGFYLIGTPIGNLKDITLRALDILREVDVIYCEDTRRSIKLLNAYEIKKPLKSCPHFKESSQLEIVVQKIQAGERVAYISDAGMPGVSDPGEKLVGKMREEGIPVHIIGGVSSLTHFIAGMGQELESFKFIGFLPARQKERQEIFQSKIDVPVIFMESPHRIESTLELLQANMPTTKFVLAKELSKISENFYTGIPAEIRKKITSFKGEWIGCILC